MNYLTDGQLRYVKDSMFWGGFASGIGFTLIAGTFVYLLAGL